MEETKKRRTYAGYVVGLKGKERDEHGAPFGDVEFLTLDYKCAFKKRVYVADPAKYAQLGLAHSTGALVLFDGVDVGGGAIDDVRKFTHGYEDAFVGDEADVKQEGIQATA